MSSASGMQAGTGGSSCAQTATAHGPASSTAPARWCRVASLIHNDQCGHQQTTCGPASRFPPGFRSGRDVRRRQSSGSRLRKLLACPLTCTLNTSPPSSSTLHWVANVSLQSCFMLLTRTQSSQGLEPLHGGGCAAGAGQRGSRRQREEGGAAAEVGEAREPGGHRRGMRRFTEEALKMEA